MNDEEHIGDGVYVSLVGRRHIKIRTPRPDGDHEIWLDSSAISRLQDYLRGRKIIS